MVRFVRCAARRQNSLAGAIGSIIFVAIALLIVTVGFLATESSLPRTAQDTASWHTRKVGRMAECGGDEFVPAQIEESRLAAPIVTPVTTHYFSPIEFVQPELVGVSQAHGLRAPPLV